MNEDNMIIISELENTVKETIDLLIPMLENGLFKSAAEILIKIKTDMQENKWPKFTDYTPLSGCLVKDYLTCNPQYTSKNMIIENKTMDRYREFFNSMYKPDSHIPDMTDFYNKMANTLKEFYKKYDVTSKKMQSFIVTFPAVSKMASMNMLLDLHRSQYESITKLVSDMLVNYVITLRTDLSKDAKKMAQKLISIDDSYDIIYKGRKRHQSDIAFLRNAISHDGIEIHENHCIFYSDGNPEIRIDLTFDELLEWLIVSIRKSTFLISIFIFESLQMLSETIFFMKHGTSSF